MTNDTNPKIINQRLERKNVRLKNIKNEMNKNSIRAKLDYKNKIISSYLKVFSQNYGDNLDYTSLISSLKFNFKESKDGNIIPSFQFNPGELIFRSDSNSNYLPFNENSREEFVTLDEYSKPDSILHFSNKKDSSTNSKEEGQFKNDGYFIGISSPNERYGEFNRINKIAGYTPVEESGKQADKIIKNAFQKI